MSQKGEAWLTNSQIERITDSGAETLPLPWCDLQRKRFCFAPKGMSIYQY